MSGKQAANLLASVRQALKRGDTETARRLLLAASRKQPDNYHIWLWLAGITTSPQEALDYVKKAEDLEPDDPNIARARAWAEARLPRPAVQAQQPFEPPIAPERLQPIQAKASRVQIAGPKASRRSDNRRSRFLKMVASAVIVIVVGAALLSIAGLAWFNFSSEPDDSMELAFVSPPATVPASQTQVAPQVTETIRSELPETATQNPPAVPSSTPELAAKNIVAGAAESRPTWTLTPIPTDTPTPTPTLPPTFVAEGPSVDQLMQPLGLAPNERWIDVSLSAQRLVAYEGRQPVFETLVSTGQARYPTVTGQFRIWLRLESQDMDGYRLGFDYYLKGVPYVQYFYQDYALHGTYWHSNFGNPMSHGCVNLSPDDAAWLFNFATYGTLVNVHP